MPGSKRLQTELVSELSRGTVCRGGQGGFNSGRRPQSGRGCQGGCAGRGRSFEEQEQESRVTWCLVSRLSIPMGGGLIWGDEGSSV